MNERNALVAGPGTLPGKLPLAGAAAKAIAPPKVSPIGGKVLTNEERAELDRLTAKFEAHDLTLSERVRYYMLLGYDQARATELAGL